MDKLLRHTFRIPLSWLFLLNLSLMAHAGDEKSKTTDKSWPSFRGRHASGVADGQNLPDQWNGDNGSNIKWKTPIPGLAHSSPIVWAERVFVTTAISSAGDHTFKHGLYGDGAASTDRSVHRWLVYCLAKTSGEIIWEALAAESVPKDKRHIKATYANSTPATNGEIVVAFFGSEGLFAFDMAGKFLWEKDLGRLNAGAYDLPSYEWGTASSPIIYRDLVIVQCDTQGEDFLIALDTKTGRTVWKTQRDELPSFYLRASGTKNRKLPMQAGHLSVADTPQV